MAEQPNMQRAAYDLKRQRDHKDALTTLTRIENQVTEIRQAVESDGGSVTASATRNLAGDIAELATYLARRQTLNEWRFLVTDDTENGGK